MRSKIGPIILLVIGVWFAGFAGTAKGEGKSLPNILVILVDDLGWGDLSCFGAPDLQTPHVDRLAQEGMRMVNFYANCPVCSPTRASLLTGCYPDKVGVPGVIRTHSWNSWGYLNPQIELLPGCLAKAGYQTALVGKWHLGLDRPNIPTARGFGYFHGFLGDMMDDFWNHRRHGINYMRENEQEIDPPGHATDLFTEWACNYIRTHRAKSPDVPFFLYLAYNAPHVPIQPPEDWLNRYRERHPGATEKRAKLAAFIEHMDDGVGRVLKTLDDTGVAANTIVIFTSDNGGQLDIGANNGPYRAGKGTMYEGGIRVPMVVRWPGVVKAGTESQAVALTMDLFPTLLQVAGIATPTDRDGVSLLRIWRGEQENLPDRDLFWVRLEGHEAGFSYAIRRGKYKLIRPAPTKKTPLPDELYDLEADPYEKNELSQTQPQVFLEMSRLLRERIRQTIDIPWRDERGLGPGEISTRE